MTSCTKMTQVEKYSATLYRVITICMLKYHSIGIKKVFNFCQDPAKVYNYLPYKYSPEIK